MPKVQANVWLDGGSFEKNILTFVLVWVAWRPGNPAGEIFDLIQLLACLQQTFRESMQIQPIIVPPAF